MNRLMLLILSTAVITGCQTIVFRRGEDTGSRIVSKWHHSVFMSLVETSMPVEAKQLCHGEWTAIRVSDSIATGLFSMFHPYWNPEHVELSCENGQAPP